MAVMISTTILSALLLSPQAAEPFLRYPDVHGDQIVFSSEGDLWLGSIKSGRAERITADAGVEDNPVFSPEGATIAFHGEYDGIRGAYTVPTTGGAPKRLTYAMNFRSVTGWTADGKNVVFRKFGIPTSYEYWLAPVGPGAFKQIPLEFASHVWMGPDDDTYCFTRFSRWYANWFHYIGGMSNQIWIHKDGKFKQITDVEGTNEFPVWCGDRIYFANEKESKFTLMSVSINGGKTKAETEASPFEIRELSTDGKSVVYEKGRTVEVFDPTSGKASAVAMDLHSDLIHTRSYQVSAQDAAVNNSLTPNAKRVLVEARGQIVSLPVGEGEARVWKSTPGVRLQLATMSPDAKKMAYVSDASGEQQIYVSEADGGNAKLLTTGQRQIKSLKWSPDSNLIAYYDSRMSLQLLDLSTGKDTKVDAFSANWFGPNASFSPDSKWLVYSNSVMHTNISAIFLYKIAEQKVTQLGESLADDSNPAFSSDGKWIVFTSNRSLGVTGDAILNQLNLGSTGIVCLLPLEAATPSPFALKDPNEGEGKPAAPTAATPEKETKIDLEGLYDRRIEIPGEARAYRQVGMFKERILMSSDGQILYYDIGAKKGGTVTPGGTFEMSNDGSKILVGSPSAMRVVDSTGADLPVTAGAVSFGQLKLQVTPLAEWKQIFWDAWRLLRDYFYLENMHGNDWTVIGAKYSALLPSVRSRIELDELIRWMQGEIGSSHEYLSPGDVRSVKPRVAPAYLGIDLESAGQHLKIKHIVKGDGFRTGERSPLADPSLGVKEGMYLLKVGGNPVSSSVEVYDQLLGRVGQVVSVTVNDKPTNDGAKTVLVKPVAEETRMRYVEWVAANRAYVEKASGGKVGYIHLSAMGNGDMSDFVKQYFPQQRKEAMIVDVRYNNGGFIQTMVNNVLGAKITGYFNMRNSREPWSRQNDGFIGPMCCVINEFSISCGEEFPDRFKALGLGPLIGRRTMGGEVGSSPGWPLVDGGVVSVPNYGMFTTTKGWVIEGAGVSPDIDVPSDPNAFVNGTDPQLDASVKSMLDALKKKPVVWPKEPAPRIRVKK